MDDRQQSFDEWASRPFRPVETPLDAGTDAEASLRIATALEYIAAQLGEICRKLDYVGAGYTASRQDLEDMKTLLRKL